MEVQLCSSYSSSARIRWRDIGTARLRRNAAVILATALTKAWPTTACVASPLIGRKKGSLRGIDLPQIDRALVELVTQGSYARATVQLVASHLRSTKGLSSIRTARGTQFWTGNRRADWKAASRLVNMERLLLLRTYPSGAYMANPG